MALDRGNRSRENVSLAILAVAGITVLDILWARELGETEPARASASMRDYSARREMPRPPDAMRGAARDFQAPRDMRIPEAMRPYTSR